MAQFDPPGPPSSDAGPSSSSSSSGPRTGPYGGPHTGPYGGPRTGPYGGPRSGFAGRGARFFDWVRSLGVTRVNGWLGGVCEGVANRIGIDPLIVRGIVVVAAILGAPLVLLYAVAWALLPDRDGRIHLQRLFDGDVDSTMVGIGVLALLALLPWSGGPWWTGTSFWDVPTWGAGIGRALWTLIVLAAATALVVGVVYSAQGRRDAQPGPGPDRPADGGAGPADGWRETAEGAASRTAAQTAPTTVTGPAGYTDQTTHADQTTEVVPTQPEPPTPTSTDAGAYPTAAYPTAAYPANAYPTNAYPTDAYPTAAYPTAPVSPLLDTSAEPTEPPPPAPTASSEELADWQTRHAAWAAEHAAWKERLRADMRAVKVQRATEVRLTSSAAAAEAAERRRAYRAANPRIGAAAGWATVGLALIAAALTGALWPVISGTTGWGLTAAAAAATFVFGLAVLAAGIGRRRSGFILFLALVLAALTIGSACVSLGLTGMVHP